MSYGYGQPQYLTYPSPAPAAVHQPRRSAPPSVQIVAILQYLGGLSLLLAAAIFGTLALTRDTGSITTTQDFVRAEDIPLVVGVAAGAVGLIGLIVLVFARKLQRGRQWARVLMLIFCTMSLAAGGYAFLIERDPAVLSGVIFPALYVLLLNTRAARSWFRSQTW